MLRKLKLTDLGKRIEGQKIFLRTDFNVPLKDKVIQNDFRIKQSLSSIDYILKQKPKNLVIGSHLGRPDGKPNYEYTLYPVYKYLKDIYGDKVIFADEPLVDDRIERINDLDDRIILLENLRFYEGEEGKYVDSSGKKIKSSKEEISTFRQKLNNLCDIYVNDAFGTMHRAHSSIVGIDKKYKAAGNLVEKELESFGKFLEQPTERTTIVLGGAKVEDKIPIIKNLIKLCDDIIIGGAMAFTFLKAVQGATIGQSIYEEHQIENVHQIMEQAEKNKVNIHLPVDILCAKEKTQESPSKLFTVKEGIPPNWTGFDIGDQTIENYKKVIQGSDTILMNGLMGVFEIEQFSKGSRVILTSIADATKKGTNSLIGGGDTASCATKLGLMDNITHISTGGGASLELLSGVNLPGILHLSDKNVLDAQLK